MKFALGSGFRIRGSNCELEAVILRYSFVCIARIISSPSMQEERRNNRNLDNTRPSPININITPHINQITTLHSNTLLQFLFNIIHQSSHTSSSIQVKLHRSIFSSFLFRSKYKKYDHKRSPRAPFPFHPSLIAPSQQKGSFDPMP